MERGEDDPARRLRQLVERVRELQLEEWRNSLRQDADCGGRPAAGPVEVHPEAAERIDTQDTQGEVGPSPAHRLGQECGQAGRNPAVGEGPSSRPGRPDH